MEHATPATKSQRYEYLDLLRGFAAIAVLIVHYRGFFASEPGEWVSAAQYPFPAYNLLWPLYEHGMRAVQLFWILSGFVFAVSYGASGRQLDIRTFAVHRFARLYPLHLATLCALAILQALSMWLHGQWQVVPNNDIEHFGMQLGMASAWFSTDNSFNAPIWSVSVEMLIYLSFAGFMRLFGCNYLVAGIFAIAGVLIQHWTQNNIAWCGALFYTGFVVFRISTYLSERFGRWALAIITLVFATSVATIPLSYAVGQGARWSDLLVYLCFPSLVILISCLDLGRFPFPKRARWIGASTYSIYLMHIPLMVAAKTLAPNVFSNTALVQSWIMLLGYIVVVVFVAYFVHLKFELPLQSFIRSLFSLVVPASRSTCDETNHLAHEVLAVPLYRPT